MHLEQMRGGVHVVGIQLRVLVLAALAQRDSTLWALKMMAPVDLGWQQRGVFASLAPKVDSNRKKGSRRAYHARQARTPPLSAQLPAPLALKAKPLLCRE